MVFRKVSPLLGSESRRSGHPAVQAPQPVLGVVGRASGHGQAAGHVHRVLHAESGQPGAAWGQEAITGCLVCVAAGRGLCVRCVDGGCCSLSCGELMTRLALSEVWVTPWDQGHCPGACQQCGRGRWGLSPALLMLVSPISASP